MKARRKIEKAVGASGDGVRREGGFSQEELRERNEILATAVEQAAESVMITGSAGIIEYVNPAFERITGYKREEIIGKTPAILKSGKQNQAFYKAMWDTISRGKVWTGRVTNKRKDGSLYQVEMSISPIRDAEGAIIKYVSVKRDVTEERRLERQLRRAQKMEAIATLAGGIAHDFNNIVTAILGFTDLVMNELPEGSKACRRLRYVRDAGQRARDLVKQMLAFSRRTDAGMKPVDITPVVKETLKLIGATAPSTIEIRLNIEPDIGMVLADPGQIEQVVMNLCTNAVQSMSERGGNLDVSLSSMNVDEESLPPDLHMATGRYLKLSVSDTGCGIDNSLLDRIFDPFFTTKKVDEGTGLGLAMVHSIVKSHNGAVTVMSEAGKGSVFTVFLPLLMARAEEPDQSVEPGVIVNDV